MCGIVGYVSASSTLANSKNECIRDALVMNTVRGYDSAGVFAVAGPWKDGDEGKWKWLKDNVTGSEFVHDKDFPPYLRTPWWAFFGHNRAATIGTKTRDNAHPFHAGRIILIHNGTVGDTGVDKDTQKAAGIEVDSHAIAHALNEVPHAKAAQVLGRLIGSYALVWYDTKEELLTVARNFTRPLYVGFGTNAAYFSSEPHIMMAAAERQHVVISDWREVKENKLIVFKRGEIKPYMRDITYVPKETTRRSRSAYSSPFMTAAARSSNLPTGNNYPHSTASVQNLHNMKIRATEGKMLVNGEWHPIPESSIDTLLWFNLRGAELVEFLPLLVEPLPTQARVSDDNQKVRVWGYLQNKKDLGWMPVYLYTTAINAREQSGKEWLVRASTMDFQLTGPLDPEVRKKWSGKNKEPDSVSLQCSLVFPFLPNAWATGKETPSPKAPLLLPTMLVPGPHGMITVDEYQRRTAGGCMMCDKKLPVMAAEETVWIKNPKLGHVEAICPACDRSRPVWNLH